MNLSEIIAKHYIRFPGPRTIECGEGWSSLIENFLMELDRLDQKFRITFFCMKEKFGLLTIQPNYVDQMIWDDYCKLEEKYTNLSSITCEQCGKEGKVRSKDWLVLTRCDKCFKSENVS